MLQELPELQVLATQDLAVVAEALDDLLWSFDADAFIVDNGAVLVESKRFSREPQLVGIALQEPGLAEDEALSLAAALETGSSHPLAVAILARAKAGNAPVPPASGAKAIAGKGVTGRVGGRVEPGSQHGYDVVIEMDADTWLALATGTRTWSDEVAQGRISASGSRADLSLYLPLFEQ